MADEPMATPGSVGPGRGSAECQYARLVQKLTSNLAMKLERAQEALRDALHDSRPDDPSHTDPRSAGPAPPVCVSPHTLKYCRRVVTDEAHFVTLLRFTFQEDQLASTLPDGVEVSMSKVERVLGETLRRFAAAVAGGTQPGAALMPDGTAWTLDKVGEAVDAMDEAVGELRRLSGLAKKEVTRCLRRSGVGLPTPQPPAAPAQATPAHAAPGPHQTGRVKLVVCPLLADDWDRVADYVGVPVAERRTMNGARDLWDWLELKGRLGELREALADPGVGRSDLLVHLNGPPWGRDKLHPAP